MTDIDTSFVVPPGSRPAVSRVVDTTLVVPPGIPGLADTLYGTPGVGPDHALVRHTHKQRPAGASLLSTDYRAQWQGNGFDLVAGSEGPCKGVAGFDPAGGYDATTGTYTIQKAGYYYVSGWQRVTGAATGPHYLNFYDIVGSYTDSCLGLTLTPRPADGFWTWTLKSAGIYSLTANQQIQFLVTNQAGSAGTVSVIPTGLFNVWLWMEI